MLKKIPVQDFREQLRLRASPVEGMNVMKTGEESLPAELAMMDRERREKKLLEYQTKIKKGNVNQFLQSKYANGAFNEAVYEGYDNSKQRLENGITFDYHVYFDRIEKADGTDRYAGQRPATHYLITEPIVSPYGDRYYYHIPVHYTNIDKTEIATDIDNEIVNNNSHSVSQDGLVYALRLYKDNIKTGRNQFDNRSYNSLFKHGFIKNGKFDGSIPEKVVEKYLLSINEKDRHNAIIYLNREFAQAAAKEAESEKKDEDPEKKDDDDEPKPKVEDDEAKPKAEDDEPKPKAEDDEPKPKAEDDEQTPKPKPKSEDDEQTPKPKPKVEESTSKQKVLNTQQFRARVESVRDEVIKSIEKTRGRNTSKTVFINTLYDNLSKVIKEITLDVKKVASNEVNENFDEEELKEKLKPFKNEAKEEVKAYNASIVEETAKLNEIGKKVIDKELVASSAWSENSLTLNYPKWKEKVDSIRDESLKILKKSMVKHSLGEFEKFEEDFKQSVYEFLDDMDETAERLDKLDIKLEEWIVLQRKINALVEKDPVVNIGTAKPAVDEAVKTLEPLIKNLDFDKAEAKFRLDKYSIHFQKHENSYEKQSAYSKERLSATRPPTAAEKKKAARAATEKAEEEAKLAAQEQARMVKAAEAAKKREEELKAEKDAEKDVEEAEDEVVIERKPLTRPTRTRK